mgnify:CR=1 FL=1
MVDQLIQKYIKPILATECIELGIDPRKIRDVKGCYPKPFEYDSYLQENQDGTYTIRIGIDNANIATCIRTFLHELCHAKLCEGKQRHSELKCTFYAWKRYLQLLLSNQSTED